MIPQMLPNVALKAAKAAQQSLADAQKLSRAAVILRGKAVGCKLPPAGAESVAGGIQGGTPG